MKKIGLIAAMQEEMNSIKEIMENTTEKNIYELTFIEGKINEKDCVLVQCGIGKVNSSRVTQILIDNYDIEYIINVGSAGAANNELDIGDIVIGKKLVQHDFDITAMGYPKGYITNVGQFVESDSTLIEKLENIISKMTDEEFKIQIGTIASGDVFCTESEMKDKIRKKYNADAIEMEGASIAQVCKLDNIPFVVIRSISDKPDGKNVLTFVEFIKKASKRCAIIIKELCK